MKTSFNIVLVVSDSWDSPVTVEEAAACLERIGLKVAVPNQSAGGPIVAETTLR